MHVDTDAIILRRISYGEADQIVTFFSRDEGRSAGLAKAAKKSVRRFGSALEPGALVRLRYRRRSQSALASLDSADVLVPMSQLYRSLGRITSLSEALELALGFLQEHEAAPQKFDLLSSFIQLLAERSIDDDERARFYFSWLKLSGYEPHLISCLSCGVPREGKDEWSFSPPQGGILCSGCAVDRREAVKISPDGKGFAQLFRAQAEHILGKALESHAYGDL